MPCKKRPELTCQQHIANTSSASTGILFNPTAYFSFLDKGRI